MGRTRQPCSRNGTGRRGPRQWRYRTVLAGRFDNAIDEARARSSRARARARAPWTCAVDEGEGRGPWDGRASRAPETGLATTTQWNQTYRVLLLLRRSELVPGLHEMSANFKLTKEKKMMMTLIAKADKPTGTIAAWGCGTSPSDHPYGANIIIGVKLGVKLAARKHGIFMNALLADLNPKEYKDMIRGSGFERKVIVAQNRTASDQLQFLRRQLDDGFEFGRSVMCLAGAKDVSSSSGRTREGYLSFVSGCQSALGVPGVNAGEFPYPFWVYYAEGIDRVRAVVYFVVCVGGGINPEEHADLIEIKAELLTATAERSQRAASAAVVARVLAILPPPSAGGRTPCGAAEAASAAAARNGEEITNAQAGGLLSSYSAASAPALEDVRAILPPPSAGGRTPSGLAEAASAAAARNGEEITHAQAGGLLSSYSAASASAHEDVRAILPPPSAGGRTPSGLAEAASAAAARNGEEITNAQAKGLLSSYSAASDALCDKANVPRGSSVAKAASSCSSHGRGVPRAQQNFQGRGGHDAVYSTELQSQRASDGWKKRAAEKGPPVTKEEIRKAKAASDRKRQRKAAANAAREMALSK